MTTEEATKHGKKVRQYALGLVEMGDMAAWALTDSNWWLCEESFNLGIVNQNGGIDMNGEIARAFVKGFKGNV